MQETMDRGTDAGEATLRLVQDHAGELLHFARRFSLCSHDAQDAYQRGIEILVRRMRTEPPEHPLNWLRTVIRNECTSVRTEREQLVGYSEIDLDREHDRDVEDPAERVTGFERLGQVAEALQRLKSQEVAALVMRAEGLSYKEICARTGWTYTKCNRAITEGRRALRDRLGAIESGAECDRWLPHLSLLADGEATARDLAELRPHLRGCAGCRATLRRFHDAPHQVAALVPVALVPVAAGDPGVAVGHLTAVMHALAERVTFAAMRVQGALDALPGAKVAAVAASTAALAGGGVAIEHVAHGAPAHPVAQRSVPVSAPATGLTTAPLVTTSISRAQLLAAAAAARDAAARRAAAPAGEFGVEGTSPPPSEFADTSNSARPVSSTAQAAASSPAFTTTTTPSPAPASIPPPERAQPPGEFAGP